ncbi:MAG: cytochrome B [Cyclobacteriaceae bacterium]|jgi:hypothetical protein|nr:cytochrome B [Cyclobacteriaceae bacterium]
MYTGLFHSHSGLRYIVLVLLVVVVVRSAAGFFGKKSFTKADDKLSLFLFISTHIQLLLGIVLYFVSPWVKWGSDTMKVAETRYWTVEHLIGMLIAVGLITVARISSKKLPDDISRHRRMFIFNLAALLIIVLTIMQSGRPVFIVF